MLHQVHLSAEPCCVCTERNDQIIPSSLHPHLCSLSSFSAIGPCVGSITAPYAGLPIQLVTYLWHATFSSLCVILVVYHHLMFCSMLLCTCMHVRPPGGSFSVLVVLLLISGHLIPWSAREGLVEAAISTQRSPQTAKRPFILHYDAFFFFSKINIPHSPASQAKLPHLYFIHNKPTSPRNMAPRSLFPFSAAQFHPPFFPFALKRAAEAVGRRSEAECPLKLHAAHWQQLAWEVSHHAEPVPDIRFLLFFLYVFQRGSPSLPVV